MQTFAPIESQYILKSLITKDSNNKPKVLISKNILSLERFNAAVAIDGTTKSLVLFALIAVLLFKLGFYASNS